MLTLSMFLVSFLTSQNPMPAAVAVVAEASCCCGSSCECGPCSCGEDCGECCGAEGGCGGAESAGECQPPVEGC